MKRAAIIKAFLKARRWRIISGLCCLGFAIATTVIASLPWLPMVCLVGMCFLCLLGFWYADLVAFRRRYQWLVTISDSNNRSDLAEQESPKAEDDIEEMYRSLLQQKENDKKVLTEDARQQRKEQADCYVQWISQMKPPISAMRLLLQSVPSQQREDMYAELFRMEHCVDMALFYQRLFSDSHDMVMKKYSLQTIVKGTVRKFARLFEQKGIQLQMGPLEGTVVTDEKWLGFAISQVLANALAYTPEGGRVVLAKEEPCTLLIADSGVGIEPEELPKVFEKGYVGSKNPREKASAGLGLYVTQRALALMGHNIEIQSRPGRGTLVKLVLENAGQASPKSE